jgi:hypothetical protein
MEALPVGMQWVVSFASVLSSIGVIVALIQLKISGDQFKQQLQITQRQFKLTNQGYIQCPINHDFFTDKNQVATLQEFSDPTTLYSYIFPVAALENVGNLPVMLSINHFKVFFDGKEVYHTPELVLQQTENIIYPKQSLQFMLGRVFFSDQMANLTLQQIQDLKLTCKILVTYNDYNDSVKKTIDRELELSGIYLINKKINDSIPLLQ